MACTEESTALVQESHQTNRQQKEKEKQANKKTQQQHQSLEAEELMTELLQYVI